MPYNMYSMIQGIAPDEYISGKADQQTGDEQRCRSALKRGFWSLLVPRDLLTSNFSLFRQRKLSKMPHLPNRSSKLLNSCTSSSVDLFTNSFNFISLSIFTHRCPGGQINPWAVKSLPGLVNHSWGSKSLPGLPRFSSHSPGSQISSGVLKSNHWSPNVCTLGLQVNPGISNHSPGPRIIALALKSLPRLSNQ